MIDGSYVKLKQYNKKQTERKLKRKTGCTGTQRAADHKLRVNKRRGGVHYPTNQTTSAFRSYYFVDIELLALVLNVPNTANIQTRKREQAVGRFTLLWREPFCACTFAWVTWR